MMTRLLVDGVFFQLNNSGIARVWRSILEILATDPEIEILFLDRGNAPIISNINYVPFPAYQVLDTAADSQLIQKICDTFHVDAFTSTYYTTPVTTPMVLMVYDMIPELFDFDMSHRIWMEKIASICYAQRYLCISENTRVDLLAMYPEIPAQQVSMAHCGVDTQTFRQREVVEVTAFRERHGLQRPYVLFVGSRVQHNGYKNSGLFFEALSRMEDAEFDVFCVGGEPTVEPEILARLPSGVRCQRVSLSDDELALAYGGALALVYPSLYEGFGMPVIEAMASGCPVITTHHGSLAEAAGDAALTISGVSVDEMCAALVSVQDGAFRDALRQKGLAHVNAFRWTDMAQRFKQDLALLLTEARAGAYDNFFVEWKRIRDIQANVDFTQ